MPQPGKSAISLFIFSISPEEHLYIAGYYAALSEVSLFVVEIKEDSQLLMNQQS